MQPDSAFLAIEQEFRNSREHWRRFFAERLPDPHTRSQAVVYLWSKCLLSEGQGAKVLGLDRVAFRTLCQELNATQDDSESGPACPETGSDLCFELHSYADVSTAYLSAEDQELILRTDAPYHLANLDRKEGSFFYLPSDRQDWALLAQECTAFGFSSRFAAILKALYGQRIYYIRFDRDGGPIDNLDRLE